MPHNTPAEPLSRAVRYHCKDLSKERPVFLDYADFGYPPMQCHVNVAHMVKKRGGEAVFGWVIWAYKQGKHYVEGEFHCVWRDPATGDLVDVTPRSDGEPRVLFLPDPARGLERRGDVLVTWSKRTTLKGMRYGLRPTPQYEVNHRRTSLRSSPAWG